MFCGNCGSYLPDDARFCESCGAPTTEANVQQNVGRPSGNRRVIIISAIAIAVILIVAIAVVLVFQQSQKKATPRPIQVSIKAEGYTDECTKIPVVATGTNSSGANVETVGFVDGTGYGMGLEPGSYELSFPASPLTPDGVLYKTPGVTETVVISEDQEDDSVTKAFEDSPAVFEKSTAINETDEMIDKAYEYAIMDGTQKDRAEQLKVVADDTHSKAVEAEQQRQAKEAARRIEMPNYTLVIPDYWVGKIEVLKEGNGVYICPKGGSKNSAMISANVYPAEDEMYEGDIATFKIKDVRLTNGNRAQIWGSNWVLEAIAPTEPLPSDGILDQCIQLESGGKVTLADVRRDIPSYGYYSDDEFTRYSHICYDYLEANLALTPK